MLNQKLNILLPGLNNQVEFFIDKIDLKNRIVLVIGSGSAEIGKQINNQTGHPVDIIVEDYDSHPPIRRSMAV